MKPDSEDSMFLSTCITRTCKTHGSDEEAVTLLFQSYKKQSINGREVIRLKGSY